MAISNRYEFMYFVECINGNPNGDPDMGNSPRLDPQDMRGLISDVAVKRRIRNYIQFAKPQPGNEHYGIIIQQSTNINKYIAKAHEETGNPKMKKSRANTELAREWLCKHFYDVRTFGGVLSTGANAGQVRGPVQMTFLRSVDPILPLDISITRMAVAENLKKGLATSAEYEEWEREKPEDELRTMGRKQIIPYGLYEGRGFISANLAQATNFSQADLKLFWQALLGMYEHDRSASKGQMSTIPPVIIFKHVGTDTDEEQRIRQSMLGCAPAHQLFNLVSLKRREEVETARSYEDYLLTIDEGALPAGVELLYAVPAPEGAKILSCEEAKELDWVKIKQ